MKGNSTVTMVRGEDGTYTATLVPDETGPQNPGDQARLEKGGIMGSIEGISFAGIHIGEAGVGGGSALLITEFVDAFVNPAKWGIPAGAVKLVLAWVMAHYGKRVLGQSAANLSASFLAFDGIREIVPLEAWIAKGINMLRGIVPTTIAQQPQLGVATNTLSAWLQS